MESRQPMPSTMLEPSFTLQPTGSSSRRTMESMWSSEPNVNRSEAISITHFRCGPRQLFVPDDTTPHGLIRARGLASKNIYFGPPAIILDGGFVNPRNIYLSDPGDFVAPSCGTGTALSSRIQPTPLNKPAETNPYKETPGSCVRCRQRRRHCDTQDQCSLCKLLCKPCVYDEISIAGTSMTDEQALFKSQPPIPEHLIPIAVFKDSHEEEASAKRRKVRGGKARTLEDIPDENAAEDLTEDEDWETIGAEALRNKRPRYGGLS